jgi:hypothetical protein
MPSTQVFFAQPITRKYIVTQNETNGENGAYYFTQATVDSWLSNNSSDLSAIGSTVIISGDFNDITDNLNSDGRYEDRKTLTDMGKEIVIGNSANSRLITLRKVQGQQGASEGGLGGLVAYICVENNTTDTPSNRGRFTPRVARI